MYKSFRIRNFRCFHDLMVRNLQRVNLIAGFNNTGKTTFLEALFLHAGKFRPELTTSLGVFRGIDTISVEIRPGSETLWDSYFEGFETSESIKLEGIDGKGTRSTVGLRILRDPRDLSKVRNGVSHDLEPSSGTESFSRSASQVLELRHSESRCRPRSYYLILDSKGLRTEPIPPSLPFVVYFHASRARAQTPDDASLFGRLDKIGKQDVLVNALRLIEPRLKRLSVVVAGKPMIHGDVGLSRLVPLNNLGEGMVRLATFVLYICTAPKGVVLVDEIENGFHHSILPKVWQVIAKAARESDTQVFATTHSMECIRAAHESFMNSPKYDFRLYRLQRAARDVVRAVSYDKGILSAAIEAGLEVR